MTISERVRFLSLQGPATLSGLKFDFAGAEGVHGEEESGDEGVDQREVHAGGDGFADAGPLEKSEGAVSPPGVKTKPWMMPQAERMEAMTHQMAAARQLRSMTWAMMALKRIERRMKPCCWPMLSRPVK